MLLWGEGATPAVVRAIEKVTMSARLARGAGLTDLRRYRACWWSGVRPRHQPRSVRDGARQPFGGGYAPPAMMAGSIPATSPRTYRTHWSLLHPSGSSRGRDTRYRWAHTPHFVDAGQDFRAEGRTLAVGARRTDGPGLRRFAATGFFPDHMSYLGRARKWAGCLAIAAEASSGLRRSSCRSLRHFLAIRTRYARGEGWSSTPTGRATPRAKS